MPDPATVGAARKVVGGVPPAAHPAVVERRRSSVGGPERLMPVTVTTVATPATGDETVYEMGPAVPNGSLRTHVSEPSTLLTHTK